MCPPVTKKFVLIKRLTGKMKHFLSSWWLAGWPHSVRGLWLFDLIVVLLLTSFVDILFAVAESYSQLKRRFEMLKYIILN